MSFVYEGSRPRPEEPRPESPDDESPASPEPDPDPPPPGEPPPNPFSDSYPPPNPYGDPDQKGEYPWDGSSEAAPPDQAPGGRRGPSRHTDYTRGGAR